LSAVLVTGASGFVGRHVARALVAGGHDVVGVSRQGGTAAGLAIQRLNLADAREVEQWSASRRFDAIVHLAATVPSSSDQHPQGYGAEEFVADLSATLNVLGIAERYRCPVVFMSGVNVYGAPGAGILTEEAPLAPRDLYAASKLAGETACRRMSEAVGLPCAILRLSSPYGPDHTASTVLYRFLEAACRSAEIRLYGTGTRTQDFLHVDDASRAVVALVEDPCSGIFNLGSGKPTSMRELARSVLEAVPSSRTVITMGDRPDPQEGYHLHLSIEKLARAVRWKPSIPLVEGLQSLSGEYSIQSENRL
jgi:nucleoside-diphosphate-sugar epimerase